MVGVLQVSGGPRTIGTENRAGRHTTHSVSPLGRLATGKIKEYCSEAKNAESGLDLRPGLDFSIDPDC